MGKDKRGVERGRCTTCDCEEYEVIESHHILCDYCGHPPMVHLKGNSADLCPSPSSPANQSEGEHDDEASLSSSASSSSALSPAKRRNSESAATESPTKRVKIVSYTITDNSDSDHSDDEITCIDQSSDDNPDDKSVAGALDIQSMKFMKLQKELAGISSDGVLFKDCSDNLNIRCMPCSFVTPVGKSNKWSNFKRHVKSASHKLVKNTEEEGLSKEESAFHLLQEKYPGVFVKKGAHAVCVQCRKRNKQHASIALSAHNFKYNARKHMESDMHKEKAKTGSNRSMLQSARITSYFSTSSPKQGQTVTTEDLQI